MKRNGKVWKGNIMHYTLKKQQLNGYEKETSKVVNGKERAIKHTTEEKSVRGWGGEGGGGLYKQKIWTSQDTKTSIV